MLGTLGGSYGGTYQHLLLGEDTRGRIHAMVPQIAPANYNMSWWRNGVALAWWDQSLPGLFSTPAKTGPQPYDKQVLQTLAQTNSEDANATSWMNYHSADYWCNGTSYPSDGQGATPKTPPTKFHPANILYQQGSRDWLFPLVDAFANYKCHSAIGGDVRLWTSMYGHDSGFTAFGFTEPEQTLEGINPASANTNCGSIDNADAIVAFFNQHLKLQPNAAAALPKFCLAFENGDGVSVNSILTGHAGSQYTIPATQYTTGTSGRPAVVDLGSVGSTDMLLGGLPRLEGTISAAGAGQPTVFFAIGRLFASNPAAGWVAVDSFVTPFTGTGSFGIDFVGALDRFKPEDHMGLLLYGDDPRYDINGVAGGTSRPRVPVTVQGTLWLPIITSAQNPQPM
jgi:hypothetical protein